MKKLVSILLVISLILTASPFSLAFAEEEAEPTTYSEATLKRIELFRALQILPELCELNDDNAILTRAMFAEAIADLAGYSGETNTKQYYKDVGLEYWAYNYITYLAETGLMIGVDDGLFAPDARIKTNHAILVLMRALGYNIQGAKSIVMAISAAQRMGVLDGIKVDLAADLNAETAVHLIYNTLHAKTLEATKIKEDELYMESTDDRLLKSSFDVYQGTGRVTATSVTGISSKNGVKSGYVEIDKVLYTTELNVYECIGRKYDFYYKKGETDDIGEVILMQENDRSESTLKINAKDISGFDSYIYRYYDGDRDEEAKIALSASIIYNGIFEQNLPNAKFIPEVGDVTLIDIGEDGLYDIVLIYNYEYYHVSMIAANDKLIYDKFDKEMLNLDNSKRGKTVVIRANGKAAEFSALKADDILRVVKNTDQSFVSVETVTQKTMGTVTAISETDRLVEIEGEQYEYIKDVHSDIKVGSDGKYYLDMGKIVAYVESGEGGLSYALMMTAQYKEKGVEEKLSVKLYLDEIEVLEVADKVKYTDPVTQKKTEITPKELYEKMAKNSEGSVARAIIQYSQDSKGRINEVKLPIDRTGVYAYVGYDEDNFTLDFDTAVNASKGEEIRIFQKHIGSRYAPGAATKVYIVPKSETDSEPKHYQSGTTALLGSDLRNQYRVQIYDSNADKVPSVVVLHQDSGGDDIEGIKRNNLMTVDSVNKGMDDNGEDCYILSGWLSSAYTKKNVSADATFYKVIGFGYTGVTSIGQLERGDIVQLETAADGSVARLFLIFRVNHWNGYKETVEAGPGGGTWDGLAILHTMYGTVERVSSSYITINVAADGADAEEYVAYNRTYPLGGNVVLYDRAKNKVSKASPTDVRPGDTVFARTYYYELRDIVIYR